MRRLLLLTLLAGLCTGGEATSPRTIRVVSMPQYDRRLIIRNNRAYHSRKLRRSRVVYITAEPSVAPAPVETVTAVTAPAPRRHYFSGMVVQVATGLNAGYGTTNTTQTGATRNALAFSLMFEKKLNDTFYLCPEIAYVQRGVNTNLMSIGATTIVGGVQLNYLEIPLLLKTKLALAPRWKIFFVGGPTAGIMLNRQVEVLGLVNLDLGSRFRQFDFGIVLGTGVEFRLSSDVTIMAHLRNQIGLVNIDQTPGTTFYTRGIQLLLGAQFEL